MGTIEHEQTSCLNLCEIAPARALRIARGQATARMYFGSSFCPRMLRAWSPRDVAELCSSGSRLTLVVPIVSEAGLESALEHADRILEAGDGFVDEVTVNDFGMFMRWGELIADRLGIGLNLGRLMNKDTRDPRDHAYSGAPHVPRLIERSWDGVSALDRLLATHPVNCIEFDPTHRVLDLSGLPASVEAGVHGPVCYMSTGQICEYAGIGTPVQEKFRPNAPCQHQCQRTAVHFEGASGVRFMKLGRTVYFENPDAEVRGARRIRRIISPVGEVLG